MKRKITVGGEALRFSAAHLTTMGEECEPLHGHNYQVTVEVEGELTGDSWLLDFRDLKRMARGVCDELDHRFLLQGESRVLKMRERQEGWEIAVAGRLYVIPLSDVVVLPIDNCTAERLAEWMCGRLKEELRAAGATNLTAISVGIEEAPGQAGWYSEEFDDRPGAVPQSRPRGE
jgi:6-pyruvoyltetrahydropterin/6-carboxytetrahydropterin synthase